MPTDDLTAAVAELRRLRDAASPLPWAGGTHCEQCLDESFDVWYAIGPRHKVVGFQNGKSKAEADRAYLTAAANLAPRLADELDAARAEIERLREALRTLADWQAERRPGGAGEMCDFADAVLKGDIQR